MSEANFKDGNQSPADYPLKGEYSTAFPLGNERDARIIAASSGRAVEEFLRPELLPKTPDFVPGDWSESSDKKVD